MFGIQNLCQCHNITSERSLIRIFVTTARRSCPRTMSFYTRTVENKEARRRYTQLLPSCFQFRDSSVLRTHSKSTDVSAIFNLRMFETPAMMECRPFVTVTVRRLCGPVRDE